MLGVENKDNYSEDEANYIRSSAQAADGGLAISNGSAQTGVAADVDAIGAGIAGKHLEAVTGSYLNTMQRGVGEFASLSSKFLSSFGGGGGQVGADPLEGMRNLFQLAMGEGKPTA